VLAASLNHVAHKIHNIIENPWDLNGDGKLQLKEANRWYRRGKGKPITVGADQVDLGFLDPRAFDSSGDWVEVNLYGKNSDGFVFGKLEVKYQGNGAFSIKSNEYDFRINIGKHARNAATAIGHAWATKGGSTTVVNGGYPYPNRIGQIGATGTPYWIHFSGVYNSAKPFHPGYYAYIGKLRG